MTDPFTLPNTPPVPKPATTTTLFPNLCNSRGERGEREEGEGREREKRGRKRGRGERESEREEEREREQEE